MQRQIKRYQTPRRGIQYIVDQQVREELSPFVFFDAGTMLRNDDGMFIGYHPHSGIGIITYFDGGNLDHGDTGDNNGIIKDGGIQWIRAGGGVWHQEHYRKKPEETAENWHLSIHQLWMLLPLELEESEVEYQNIQPENVPVVDNVKVIAGSYQGVTSSLKTPYNMTYLDVKLNKGETFSLPTPIKQTRGFIFPRAKGAKLYGEDVLPNNLTVLEENEGVIEVVAEQGVRFILVLAEPFQYPIIPYRGSLHTNYEAIERSMQRIEQQKSLVKG